MKTTRRIEVFSAGCPVCAVTIEMVRRAACPSCDVTVLDLRDSQIVDRARALGVRSAPAIAIEGKLVDCCRGRGADEAMLRTAGLGQTLV